MKKILFTMALTVAIVTSASAMTFNEAREHAMFLTDKMSYELGLSPTQLNNVYEINLDFVMAAAIRGERLSTCLSRRDTDLRYVLSDYQYRIYKKTSYFNRPMSTTTKPLIPITWPCAKSGWTCNATPTTTSSAKSRRLRLSSSGSAIRPPRPSRCRAA